MGLFSKDTSGIRARFLIEIIGKPQAHIQETMELVCDQIKKHPDWTTHTIDIAPTEPRDAFFASFAHVEITFPKFEQAISFCFEYLPSSAEVLSPDHITLAGTKLSGWLNDFVGRLHESDLAAKKQRADNELLQRNTTQIFRNFLKFALASGKTTNESLSATFGIPLADIEKFITPFVNEGWVRKSGAGYELT